MNSGNRQLLNPDRRLRAGCYNMRFTPTYPYWGADDPPEDQVRGVTEYAGTMRVVHYDNEGFKAFSPKETQMGKFGLVVYISGDLYALPPWANICNCNDIPIFPVDDYRFYLLATKIDEGDRGEFTLFLDCYEFRAGRGMPPYPVKAKLKWGPALADSKSVFDYLEGPVSDELDNDVGWLTMDWVSDYLRCAVIEIDRVNDVAAPLDNYTGFEGELVDEVQKMGWDEVFEPCGWKMEAKLSDQPAEPARKIWTESELHQAMPELRDSFDVSHEWRYHIFCVGKLDDGGRGYEFKSDGAVRDSGIFESVVLAAKYEFVAADTLDFEPWGAVQGKNLDETPAYFRTAVHEIGHALNLEHNFSTPGFMATTDAVRDIAQRQPTTPTNGQNKKTNGTAHSNGTDFLGQIQWRFAPDDMERLRHWPDIVVRPGTGRRPKFVLPGIDTFRFDRLFGGADENSPELPLDFEIRPFREKVPLGAPVRILLDLTNKGDEPLRVPKLRLKAGNITGRVESRSKEVREFSPLSGPDDELGMQTLKKKQTTSGSLTLLAGPDGPLFPQPGPYTVTVDLQIYRKGTYHSISRSTQVFVDPFVDEQHRRIATLLLQSKAALVNFAIGNGLSEGDQAINLALNNPILGPHYAISDLKWLCRGLKRETGSLDRALLIVAKGEPILTEFEIAALLRKRRPTLADEVIAAIGSALRRRKSDDNHKELKKFDSTLTGREIVALLSERDPVSTEEQVGTVLKKRRPRLPKKAIAAVASVVEQLTETPASLLKKVDPELTDREITALLSKREPVLTEAEVAALVRVGRTALEEVGREQNGNGKNNKNLARQVKSAGSKSKRKPQVTFEIPGALAVDLQYIGVRIVLGNLDDSTLTAFLKAIGQGIGKLKKKLNPSRTRKMLMKLFEDSIEMGGTGSYEFAELLLAHDNKVFNAIKEYRPGKGKDNVASFQKVREAFEDVGLSTEDLRRIVARFKQVIKLNDPTLINSEILIKTCTQIPIWLKEVNIEPGLRKLFFENLYKNIRGIKKMINEGNAEQDTKTAQKKKKP